MCCLSCLEWHENAKLRHKPLEKPYLTDCSIFLFIVFCGFVRFMDREKPSNVNPSCSVWWRQDMSWGREGFIGGHEQPWFTPYEQPGPSQEEWDLIYPGYCLPAPPPRISSAFSSWRGLSLYITVPWGSKMPLCSSLVLPEVLALRLWAWSLRTTMQIRSKVCKKIFSYFHAL